MVRLSTLFGIGSLSVLLFGFGSCGYSLKLNTDYSNFCEKYRTEQPHLVQIKALEGAKSHIKDAKKALTTYSIGKTVHSPNVNESKKKFEKVVSDIHQIMDTDQTPMFRDESDLETYISRLDEVRTELANTKQGRIFHNSEKNYSIPREHMENLRTYADSLESKYKETLPNELVAKSEYFQNNKNTFENLGILSSLIGATGLFLILHYKSRNY